MHTKTLDQATTQAVSPTFLVEPPKLGSRTLCVQEHLDCLPTAAFREHSSCRRLHKHSSWKSIIISANSIVPSAMMTSASMRTCRASGYCDYLWTMGASIEELCPVVAQLVHVPDTLGTCEQPRYHACSLAKKCAQKNKILLSKPWPSPNKQRSILPWRKQQ